MKTTIYFKKAIDILYYFILLSTLIMFFVFTYYIAIKNINPLRAGNASLSTLNVFDIYGITSSLGVLGGFLLGTYYLRKIASALIRKKHFTSEISSYLNLAGNTFIILGTFCFSYYILSKIYFEKLT